VAAVGLGPQPGVAFSHPPPLLGPLRALGVAVPPHHHQLTRRQGPPCVGGRGPPVAATLRQSLHAEPVALPIVAQQLERRARTVAEHVAGPRQRVVSKGLPTHGGQSSKTCADIHGVRGEQEPALGGPWQPARPATKARTSAARGQGASTPWRRSRVPSARDSSSWRGPVGGGQEGAAGPSTQSRDLGGASAGAAGQGARCLFRSVRRNRHCGATREGGKTEARATACSQRAGGKRSPGGRRVWRQGSNCPAHWSRWGSACKGVLIGMLASMSSRSLPKDDGRPRTSEIHAGWSEAHAPPGQTPQWRGVGSWCLGCLARRGDRPGWS